MLQNLFNTILSSPILLALAIILVLLVVYAILKRIVKLAIILLLVLTAYAAYMVNTGQPLPKSGDEFVRQGKQTVESLGSNGKGIINTDHWKEVLGEKKDTKTR